MSSVGFKTAIIGFGRIASGYAEDPVMARHIPYATHAQVLRDHPAFDLVAALDPSGPAQVAAHERWAIPQVAADLSGLTGVEDIEVAVLASPPEERGAIISALPGLRAVLMEKPLAPTLAEAQAIVAECRSRGIILAVNFIRRADKYMRDLANGGLVERIGAPQKAFGVYGNGLNNNGIHLIDLIRMLMGEITSVQAIGDPIERPDPAFMLRCRPGTQVMVQPLDFGHYREIGLDIWGEKGRLEILHEGLTVIEKRVGPHRYAAGEREIIHDVPTIEQAGIGRALYEIYDNLAGMLKGDGKPVSSGENALITSAVVDAIQQSAAADGQIIALDGVG